jgi:hypothetical protein
MVAVCGEISNEVRGGADDFLVDLYENRYEADKLLILIENEYHQK